MDCPLSHNAPHAVNPALSDMRNLCRLLSNIPQTQGSTNHRLHFGNLLIDPAQLPVPITYNQPVTFHVSETFVCSVENYQHTMIADIFASIRKLIENSLAISQFIK